MFRINQRRTSLEKEQWKFEIEPLRGGSRGGLQAGRSPALLERRLLLCRGRGRPPEKHRTVAKFIDFCVVVEYLC